MKTSQIILSLTSKRTFTKFPLVFLLLVFMIIVSGCEKEETIYNEDAQIKFESVKNYTLDKISLIENKQDIHRLMQNSNDKDEEKLNNYLYQIGLATRELIKNEDFNRTIIHLAKESKNQTAYLLDLKEVAPQYYNKINDELRRNGLSLQSIADDMTHAPILPNSEHPETSEIEKYVPAIFIPNLNQIDSRKQPLLSPNIEVDSSNNERIEDYIVSWYFTQNGELKEIILGEETALTTTNPLFIVDHATVFDTSNGLVVLDSEQSEINAGNKSIIRYDSRNIKIKNGYRYESGWGNKSEYAIIGYRVQNFATYDLISGYTKDLAKVKPNQIGSTLYKPSLHAYNWLPHATNKFYWNTYERDWNRSFKPLGYFTSPINSYVFNSRRRYTNDWYAWIPSTVNIHNTPFEWYGWLECVNFTSWKAEYQVCKVE
ncbi:hypothetical protein [Aquimarina sp. 2201CG5-10]|uniref:hypothetical protein n=1 Tax=Aquimarina callyspongiae TaxID=3098150 RepID=UPI002AB3F7B2|nr:hypothetical protein [Aquimarina sp. 2201CG5-10]MDY8135782.1 hypothetical protein [Aquimarina sp. 2201CG5-10]